MNIIEKLKEFKWINRRSLETMFGIPTGTLRPNSNRKIPQRYLDMIEQEFIRFSCCDNTSKEEVDGVTVKLTKKEKVKVKEVIELATKTEPLPIDVLVEIHQTESVDKIKNIISEGQRKTVSISSEWNEDFTFKVIKIKDILADNTKIEVIDGNGLRLNCYSKGKTMISTSDNLPQKWTYLPKAYLI